MRRLKTFSRQTHKNLNPAQKRVYSLMRKGTWTSADSIKLAAGVEGTPASEGLRRMRELRDWFIVQKRRSVGTTQYEYRLVKEKNYRW